MNLIEAAGLTKLYDTRVGRFFNGRILTALSNVSFALGEGESLGVVGESGSGKTTLGKIVAGLLEPTEGKLTLKGKNSDALDRRERARFAQMVFQDPATSLNPKLSIGTQLSEAIRLAHSTLTPSPSPGIGRGWLQRPKPGTAKRWARKWLEPKAETGRVREEATHYMKQVGLNPEMLSAYPHQLSGGQRQRASIARAIAARPQVVVADEPVSSLDLSIQAQILRLLIDLKLSLGISYLVISHDLAIVAALCDRMIVLKDGVIQEEGKTGELLDHPRHPYTKRLLKSVPRLK